MVISMEEIFIDIHVANIQHLPHTANGLSVFCNVKAEILGPMVCCFCQSHAILFFQSSRFWAVAAFDGTWSDYMRFRSKLRYRSLLLC